MTNEVDIDLKAKNQPFLFGPGELDRFGIRIRPAEFARLMQCSKQAVSQWVKEGKITLGADGRLDPTKAVSQLLRNSDPDRLRAKTLAPLMRDIGRYEQRILHLENELQEARAEIAENDGDISAALRAYDRIVERLPQELALLVDLPKSTAMAAITRWMAQVFYELPEVAETLHATDYLADTAGDADSFTGDPSSGAPDEEKEGAE
jgi:hypothetical protein